MKIGLVLGGGGFVGGAWLTGALEALEDATGVLPPRFDHVVGTSAGAMIAALTTSGVHPSRVPEGFGTGPVEGSDGVVRPVGTTLRLEHGLPRPLPGSVRLAIHAMRHPRQHPVGVALAALLPKGFISTAPLKEIVRRAAPSGWTSHKNLWLMACDLGTGKRVAFGREGAPAADLADAVAASCAIPGFYCPVQIGGREYIDGGVCSPSNLDVLRHSGLDLVVCFNPTSSLHRGSTWNVSSRIGDAYRGAALAQLDREIAKLRASGTPVLAVHPTVEDLEVMGINLMAAGNLQAVSSVARRTVAAQLEMPEVRDFIQALGSLSASRPRRRPVVVGKRAAHPVRPRRGVVTVGARALRTA